MSNKTKYNAEGEKRIAKELLENADSNLKEIRSSIMVKILEAKELVQKAQAYVKQLENAHEYTAKHSISNIARAESELSIARKNVKVLKAKVKVQRAKGKLKISTAEFEISQAKCTKPFIESMGLIY